MQRYLITGGTGFIGQALCRRLAARGIALTVLTRDPSRAARLLPPGTATVSSLAQLAPAQRFDAVVNLAGEPIAAGRWSHARKARLERSRAGLTAELVHWMAHATHRPEVFLSASAIGYYGDQGDLPLTEDSAPRQEYTHALCAAWEAAALAARSAGIRTAVLRIGLVTGPEGGFLARMLPPFRLGAGGPIGSGAQWMSWIHLEDLLRLVDAVIDNPALDGVFNATAPQPVSNRDFARTLGQVLQRPARLPLPAFVLRAVFGEMARLLLTGQRVLPARAQAAGFEFLFPDLESALRDVLGRPGTP